MFVVKRRATKVLPWHTLSLVGFVAIHRLAARLVLSTFGAHR